MRDFAYQYHPTIAAGRTIIRVMNTGRTAHNLSMFSMPEGAPSAKQQADGVGFHDEVEVATILARKPGDFGVVAVNLAPNQRYLFICRIVDNDGISHYSKGMYSEFRTAANP